MSTYLSVLLFSKKDTNIENRVQIRPILYSSQPTRLQIFFRVNNNKKYNPIKKRKILIVFDDMIADMLSNKRLIQ